ncbi:cytochrome b/b6 domain-containing protein [aff. Roholtiella sp. LEGE 12411]|uniref:cytochrome b/b6 domain-containing protein n=1 Tax=aff. Roholtiella sp. LEGE 12411 TaxID=1828822 RepID=UPI0018826593|nr:cytochrome b/b6 domain-containing protein [aff. Roholtiella sp. LEGE 12411]MBE9038217.1 cytochrome b/b6 domain-containing protein [aff. Roholtiella sp. LEGE 12411]
MKSSQPYQPLLLRILHGITSLFLIAAILTAFWTYDLYDGRWGRIPLPSYKDIEGLHGTFGLCTLLIFPTFVLYAFHRGQRRLIQPNSFSKLAKVGEPIWWYTLNRFTNTFALFALNFALFSGKMMDETWLPKGELNHTWYYAHLIAWVIIVVSIALHILMNARVGGLPLLLSMLNWQFRDKDSPALWSTHLSTWWSNLRRGSSSNCFQSTLVLAVIEFILLLSITAAWILPLFK